MKILHIYKSTPTEETKKLVALLNEGNEGIDFPLYEGEPDYDKLIELIWEADKVISWW
ncbi:hypothetical protein HNQ76_001778 [Thermosulfuriphilus ammonigenes]|uniref:hypothetical protein n=1 Tax=Thermosulfuriphilus ammonigenes TaxID=1936021 RepID=UPI00140E1786|nr:hypothetical protein [Thermosulfuriphilus ammonigenes]MBA2849384.1 hypothetical protein [Thermosulfuriphilus ammonigenes]